MKGLKHLAAAALAVGVAVALGIVSGAYADSTSLIGVYNQDNLPNVVAGTANSVSAGQCSNVNGVALNGAATGASPNIAVGGCAGASPDASGIGTLVTVGPFCTASGATPQTCNGQRGIVTTNSLSTAAATDAVFTINNSSVAATSLVECLVQAYSGTYSTNGDPVIEGCKAGAGTITVEIRNVNATNALSGTLGLGFKVEN